MAAVVRFHYDLSSVQLTMRGGGVARPRPAAADETSVCGRGIVVGLTSILDRRQFF